MVLGTSGNCGNLVFWCLKDKGNIISMSVCHHPSAPNMWLVVLKLTLTAFILDPTAAAEVS